MRFYYGSRKADEKERRVVLIRRAVVEEDYRTAAALLRLYSGSVKGSIKALLTYADVRRAVEEEDYRAAAALAAGTSRFFFVNNTNSRNRFTGTIIITAFLPVRSKA